LRRIMDEVCSNVSLHETSKKAQVACKLLACTASGDISVETLRAAGGRALE
jgi:hypothetical protein